MTFKTSKKEFIKSCNDFTIFDVFVIGAGVGGLELGITKAQNYKNKNINSNIAIIDQADYVGGRLR